MVFLRGGCRAMTITQDPGDAPGISELMPDHREIGQPITGTGCGLTEPVGPDCDCAVVLDGMHHKTVRNQLPGELSAHMVSGIGQHLLAGPGDPALVVVELDILGKIPGVHVQLRRVAALIERLEYARVQIMDGVLQGWPVGLRRRIRRRDRWHGDAAEHAGPRHGRRGWKGSSNVAHGGALAGEWRTGGVAWATHHSASAGEVQCSQRASGGRRQGTCWLRRELVREPQRAPKSGVGPVLRR